LTVTQDEFKLIGNFEGWNDIDPPGIYIVATSLASLFDLCPEILGDESEFIQLNR